ncbi:MAG: hypothetical protein IKO56_08495, partial [Alphaproteobacteria bacterium]|nr:hypothetical protein [Alphaproteobacteria bacterium]
MFHKICIFLAVAGVTGFAFGANKTQQIITSEVFGNTEEEVTEDVNRVDTRQAFYEPQPVYYEEPVYENVPVWPLPGSEADVE